MLESWRERRPVRRVALDSAPARWDDPDNAIVEEEGMSEFAGYAVGGIDKTEREPSGMKPLEDAISQLVERVEYLGHRLSPILMPESPSEALVAAHGISSDFGAQVARLRDLERRLSALTERLDI